jgi:hypothetical protein
MSMRCWYTRWQMSGALDRGLLAARLSRGHAARCAACQAFGHRLETLDAQLAHGAAAAPRPPVPRPARLRMRIAAPLALGAAAAVTLVVRGARSVEPVAEVPPARELVGTLAGVRQVAGEVSQVFADSPLETELDDLIRDGKRGVRAVLSIGGLR